MNGCQQGRMWGDSFKSSETFSKVYMVSLTQSASQLPCSATFSSARGCRSASLLLMHPHLSGSHMKDLDTHGWPINHSIALWNTD
ncbi:hypothetical protein PAMP_011254 [Pampus punctatissimus]